MAHRLDDLLSPAPAETAADRLRAALELFDTGVELVRARLRREDPEAPPTEIESRIRAWLRDVPPLRAPGYSARE